MSPPHKALKLAVQSFTSGNDKRNGTPLADCYDGLSGNDTILGFGGNDTLIGGGDTMNGNAGDDRLDGGVGGDMLDGGAGNDTARYSGPQDDYDAQYDSDSNTWTIQDVNNGDTDQLANIEFLQFSDATLDVTNGPPQPPSLSIAAVTVDEGDSGTTMPP
ncbi:MAG: hypothetical protein EPN21_08720 [Methylococcaceae bacterium]|nr:MAG: hypothetical protein EPN21_08720 [Methylococcaceae bacterium]